MVKFFLTVVLVFGVGGLFAVAETAVPGDPLYTYKIGITEKARDIAAATPAAQARWQVKLADRRMNELIKLGIGIRLDTETAELLQTLFESHVGNAITGAENLAKTHQATLSYDVLDRLDKILDEANREVSNVLATAEGKSNLNFIETSIRGAIDDSQAARKRIDAMVNRERF